MRKVGGYNLFMMGSSPLNLAKILVGSEGTLGFFTKIKLQLHRIPKHKVKAGCHFGQFYDSMEMTRHIVELGPSAVELLDRTMLDLAHAIPAVRSTIERIVRGRPAALLFVEFAGEDHAALLDAIGRLEELLADYGFPNSVVRAIELQMEAEIAYVLKAGFNIMMSMKGDGKPVSFIEDCAVPLEDLAEYTDRLANVFRKHDTTGTFYAHASVGCLHIRPVLNMKDQGDIRKMRAIAEEAFAMVREYKGSHSSEHGDGITRSEFHLQMFGESLVRAFEAVKDAFDPGGLFNPGKIVRAPRMDERRLFRYKPGYRAAPVETVLDWSNWGGILGAVEMCNNNGTCRKLDAGVMCPSYIATRDEKDVTRGRANSLRLALTGQLGSDALASDAMKDTMDLCVSCKACRRECPTGVDMARMKIEFLHQWHRRKGVSLRTKLTAYLPRYAPVASRLAPLMNLRNSIPGLAAVTERMTGLSARRKLPEWHSHVYRARASQGTGREVALFVDCFSRYFEPENARAARAVLEAAGYSVVEVNHGRPQHKGRPWLTSTTLYPAAWAVLEAAGYSVVEVNHGRPLCCGRTFLSAGLVDQAREELSHVVVVLGGHAQRGVPIVGIEPSCLLTFRDELKAILKGDAVDAIAAQSLLFEEFVANEFAQGTSNLTFRENGPREAFLHGHCHQKAFGAMPSVVSALKLVPGLSVKVIDSSCCGMAGSFGYEAEHYEISMRMAERSLLPAIRQAPANALIVADDTSCRHQIEAGAGRLAVHVARVLESALAT